MRLEARCNAARQAQQHINHLEELLLKVPQGELRQVLSRNEGTKCPAAAWSSHIVPSFQVAPEAAVADGFEASCSAR